MTIEPNRKNLITPQGVDSGSLPAERDRLPDGNSETTDAGLSTSTPIDPADIERDAPPPEELAGAPGDAPGQQLGLGEG